MNAYPLPRVHPTAALMRELFAAGFSPISWGEAQIDVDGSIELSARVSVQVGADFFAVVVMHPDKTGTFYPERRTMKALIADLRRAMKST